MSSKLRRTPLFGYDGNLGIPIIPPKNSSNNKASSSTTSHSSSTGSKFGYEYNKSKVCQYIFFSSVGLNEKTYEMNRLN